jgi:predicted amidohydrolase YtcJ
LRILNKIPAGIKSIFSIEAGKLADFTILAENPPTLPPERIKDIKVEEVIIGGQGVYKVK